MIDIFGRILTSSIFNLFENQPDILDHTSLTRMTEWNFAHHFANEISKYIFWLNHDIDVTKRSYNQRPDIIFHKRKSNYLNFLVVEIKINEIDTICIQEDKRRIREDWMSGNLEYRYGGSVVVQSHGNYKIILFHNNGQTEFSKSSEYIPLPDLTEVHKSLFNNLVGEIVLLENSKHFKNRANQTILNEYVAKLDELIRESYNSQV